nr:hypothetical protein [Virgisporangium aliadipatigenens]
MIGEEPRHDGLQFEHGVQFLGASGGELPDREPRLREALERQRLGQSPLQLVHAQAENVGLMEVPDAKQRLAQSLPLLGGDLELSHVNLPVSEFDRLAMNRRRGPGPKGGTTWRHRR